LQLRLYAKFRSSGSDIEIPDKFEGKAILSTQTAIQEIYHSGHSIGTYFSILLGIPFLLFPFLIVYTKGARRQIRIHLRDPKHHSSLAALVSISCIFSLFVVIMDGVAIHYAYATENELTKHTNFTSEGIVPLCFTAVVFGIDMVAVGIAVFILTTLLVLQCRDSCHFSDSCHYTTHDLTDSCFNCCFVGIFCCRKISESDDDRQNEKTVWLLTIIFIAPFISFGTHFSYIVVAWIQYPDHAGAISIMYILTFVYLFITCRFLYLFLSDNKNAYCKCCRGCFAKFGFAVACTLWGRCVDKYCAGTGDIESPELESIDHEDSERGDFQVWKVCVITLVGILVCGFEAWFIAGLVTLPIVEVIDDAPTYIFTFLQTIFVVFTGLITYKLFTYKLSDDTTFLATMVKACKYIYAEGQVKIPSADTDVEKAAVLLSVLIKEHKSTKESPKSGTDEGNGGVRADEQNRKVDERADELWGKTIS